MNIIYIDTMFLEVAVLKYQYKFKILHYIYPDQSS